MKILIIAASTKDDNGYGIMTKSFINILKKAESEKRIERLVVLGQATSEDLNCGFDLTITVLNPGGFTEILRRNPKVFEIYKDTKRNAFNVIFETDKLPASWDAIFRLEFITDYITQSEFMKEQITTRTDKPVFIIPPYINPDVIEEVSMSNRIDEVKFRVLTIGQYTKRKGILDAVVGFARELGNTEDAEMILKYNLISKQEADPIDTLLSTVRSNTFPGRHITNMTAISSTLQYEDIVNLYRNSSVLLMPSRGEGFGIPPVEAMLAGTPVIYTDWSALREVCNLEGNYPVEYHLDEAHGMAHYGYEKGLKYAVPVISSIMDQLRNAYTKWKDNREEYYRSNRDIMVSRYGVNAVTKQMELLLDGRKEAAI